MGNVQEDLLKGILYPVGCLTATTLLWRIIFANFCGRCNTSEKTLYGLISTTMYVLQWSVSNPHSASIVPMVPSMDLYLVVSAGYYLRAVFQRRSSTLEIVYSVVSVLALLDFITYRKGGDIAVCYLFLTEFPDLFLSVMLKVTNRDALIALADSLVHIVFRVVLFGHLLVSVVMEKKLSEDVKMNVFLIYIFSYVNLPYIVVETLWRVIYRKSLGYRQRGMFECQPRRGRSEGPRRRRS